MKLPQFQLRYIFYIFLFIAVLGLAFTADQIKQNFYINLDNSSKTTFFKNKLINKQLELMYLRQLLLNNIALSTDPFDSDALTIEHSKVASEFIKVRNQLFSISETELEIDIIQEQRELTIIAYKKQQVFIERVLVEEEFDRAKEINEELIPLLDSVNAKMREHKDIILDSANQSLKKIKRDYSQTLNLLIIAFIVVALFIAIIIQLVISKLKRQKDRLSYEATHDHLTHLINRKEIHNRLNIATKHAARGYKNYVFIFIDLDHFKPINDDYSHTVGDNMLIAVANALSGCLREHDVAGRIGGDEFVALLTDCEELLSITVAERIRKSIEETNIMHNDKKISVTSSIGLVQIDQSFSTYSQVMNAADQASYDAKESGKNCVRVYDRTKRYTSAKKH